MPDKAFPERGQKCCATCDWCQLGSCMQWEVDADGQVGIMGDKPSPGMHHLCPPPGFSCHLHKERRLEEGQKCCRNCRFLKDCECSELLVDEKGVLWLAVQKALTVSTANHLKPPQGFRCGLHEEPDVIWRVWTSIDHPEKGWIIACGRCWYRIAAHNLDELRKLCNRLNEHWKEH